MINAGQSSASGISRWLARIPILRLTVTVGRDEKLRRAVESIRDASAQKFTIIVGQRNYRSCRFASRSR